MAYRSVATANGASNANVVGSLPAGTAAGDRLLAFINVDNAASTWSSTPTGWANIGTQIFAGSTPDGGVFEVWEKKVATGSDAVTWVSSVTPDWRITIVALTGRHATAAATFATKSINQTANATPVSVSGASGSTVGGDDVVVGAMLDCTTSQSWSWSSWSGSLVERSDSGGGAEWTPIGIATQDTVANGAFGTVSATATGTGNAGWVLYVVSVPREPSVWVETFSTDSVDLAGTTGNITVNPPSGLAAGDVWLITTSINCNEVGATGIASGFTAVSAEVYEPVNSGWPFMRSQWKIAGASESAVTIPFSVAVWQVWAVSMRISGADQTTPIGSITTGSDEGGTSPQTVTPASLSVASAGSAIIETIAFDSTTNTSSGIALSSGYTEVAELGTTAAKFNAMAAGYLLRGAGTETPGAITVTTTGANPTKLIAQTFEIKPAATATPQFARPNADVSDGAWTPSTGADNYAVLDETTVSDTDYSSVTSNSTLRVGLSSVSTPDTGTRTLRYRLNGSPAKKLIVRLIENTTTKETFTHDPAPSALTTYSQTVTASISNYADLDLEFETAAATSPPSLAVTWGAVGTAASGTTSCTPGYPTGISAATSKLYCIATGRSNTANTAPTMPAGWTSIGSLEGGTGTWGIDLGTRRVQMFVKNTVVGDETGTVTVSLSGTTANTLRASIFRVEVPSGYGIDVSIGTGSDTSNDTAYSAVSTTSLAFAPDDLLVVGTAQNLDTGTGTSALSATSITFGTVTRRANTAVNNGNDHRHIIASASVTAGTATSAPTHSYTISAAGSGPSLFARMRAVEPTEAGRVTWAELEVPAAASTSGAGSSAGTSSISGTGASLGDTIGNSAGVSTVSGVGNINADTTGTAFGIATVSGAGNTAADTTGNSAGTSIVSGVGSSLSTSTGNSAGIATVSGTGNSLSNTTGNSVGVATISGDGNALADVAGNSAGTSTISGAGSSLSNTTGNSVGIATVSGVSGAAGDATGNSVGTSTISAVGQSTNNTIGNIPGTSTVSGAGKSFNDTFGIIAGSSTVSATGNSLNDTTGTIVGTSTIEGTDCLDNFNSIVLDSALDSRINWTKYSGGLYGTNDGRVKLAPSAGDTVYAYTGVTLNTDQWAEVTWNRLNSSSFGYIGPAVRVTGTGSCWGLIVGDTSTNTAYLNRYVDGFYAGENFTTAPPNPGQVVRLSIENIGGSNVRLKIYYDGVFQAQYDSSNGPTSGNPGIAAYNGLSSQYADNFRAGNLIIPNVGSAAGTSTVSGAGKSLNDTTGSVAGISTVLGTGLSLNTTTGNAVGTSTATAVGTEADSYVGTITGTSTVLATGQSTTNVIGTAVGTSIASGTGLSLNVTTGSIAGTSTVSGTGRSTASVIGTITGTSTVSGTGLSLNTTTGNAAGTSTVSAVGTEAGSYVGTSVGTSTVSATGQSTTNVIGTATGTSTIAGATSEGRSTAGNIAGTSTVTAIGTAVKVTDGAATGTASVSGSLRANIASAGTIDASSVVSGSGISLFKATGTILSTSVVQAFTSSLRWGAGSVLGISSVSSSGITLKVTTGNILASSTVVAYSRAIVNVYGIVLGTSSVIGRGYTVLPISDLAASAIPHFIQSAIEYSFISYVPITNYIRIDSNDYVITSAANADTFIQLIEEDNIISYNQDVKWIGG
jgi:fibronectin-binding autotransporter adhesin